MFSYEDADVFIRRVFDYFNGKVNRFNYPAELFIEWRDPHMGSIFASACNPSRVYFWPMVVYRLVAEQAGPERDDLLYNYLFKMHVIEGIVHELSHLDQNKIDPISRVYRDKEDIENENIYNTSRYIHDHAIEISKEFMMPIDPEDVQEFTEDWLKQYPECNHYQQVDTGMWVYSMLLEMTAMGEEPEAAQFLYEHLHPIFNDPKSIISIIIMNEFGESSGCVWVKNKSAWNTPQEIHEFLYESVFQYNVMYAMRTPIQCVSHGDIYNILIMINASKNMCTLVNQNGGSNNEFENNR